MQKHSNDHSQCKVTICERNKIRKAAQFLSFLTYRLTDSCRWDLNDATMVDEDISSPIFDDKKERNVFDNIFQTMVIKKIFHKHTFDNLSNKSHFY